MSASIDFAGEKFGPFWNDSFRILHRFLQNRASGDPIIEDILRANPTAAQLKFLDLRPLKRQGLEHFIELLNELASEARREAAEWRQPEYLGHFLQDLAAMQQTALRAAQHL